MLTTLLTTFALALPANDAITPEAPGTPAEPVSQAAQLAIKAKTIWLGDGRSVDDGVVLIEGGKIQRVGRGVEIPAGATVLEHDGVLTAGLVALHTYSGGEGDLDESTRVITANCDVVYAFNPRHKDFEDAAKAGITTVVLAPPASNLSGGVTCVVKTAGGGVVQRRAQLALSLCQEALQANRYPTSYEGAVSELNARFDEGQGAFGEAKSGELGSMIDVRSRQDVLRAISLAKRHGLKGSLYGASLAGEIAEAVKASGLSVIHQPLGTNSSNRTLAAAVRLAEAGVPFGFGLDAPGRDELSLRLSAAYCVRAGMEPVTAWKALTSGAAKIAGVDARVGVVAQGKDADLVLWSGDPLDLGTSVQAVYIDGKLVHGGDK